MKLQVTLWHSFTMLLLLVVLSSSVIASEVANKGCVLKNNTIDTTKFDTLSKVDALSNNTTAVVIPEKPTKSSKIIAWVDYLWALVGFVVLWFIANRRWLSNINITIVQRFVSKTSSFMLNIRYICTFISSSLIAFLSSGVQINSFWLNIIQNTIVVCLSIGTVTLFATKDPQLINPKGKKYR